MPGLVASIHFFNVTVSYIRICFFYLFRIFFVPKNGHVSTIRYLRIWCCLSRTSLLEEVDCIGVIGCKSEMSSGYNSTFRKEFFLFSSFFGLKLQQ
jgi:hypothetical protein